MLELCSSRVNLLSVDEETLLKEAKNLNMEKVRSAIRQVRFLNCFCLALTNCGFHIVENYSKATFRKE